MPHTATATPLRTSTQVVNGTQDHGLGQPVAREQEKNVKGRASTGIADWRCPTLDSLMLLRRADIWPQNDPENIQKLKVGGVKFKVAQSGSKFRIAHLNIFGVKPHWR